MEPETVSFKWAQIKVRTEAKIKDFTTTQDQVITERKLARTHLKESINIAEELREKELRKRV